LEAKLSVYHCAAAALLAGRMTEQEYSPSSIANAEVLALRDKVTVTVDEKIREDETHVTIELAGGETLNCHVDHVIGSSDKPMSDQDIEQKFRGLTEPLLPKARVDQLIDTCANIMKIDDAAVLARLASLA
jgi:2-methylcitrate dehydratase PrpD